MSKIDTQAFHATPLKGGLPGIGQRAGSPASSLESTGLLVRDRFEGEALPPATHQLLARTRSPKELAMAMAARVLNSHDRCAIFRCRLADQFPGAGGIAQQLALPEHLDYIKTLEFMDTGRWPKGTSVELVQQYPHLLEALLGDSETAYKSQARNAAETEGLASGVAPSADDHAMLQKSATAVCDAIHLAHLSGDRSLHLHGAPHLSALPEHLTSLRQLQHLTVSNMDIRTLPADLSKLQNLESLHLVQLGQLAALPESLGALHRLKFLVIVGLGRDKNVQLPESLAELPALQKLEVGGMRTQRPAWLPAGVRFVKSVSVDGDKA